MHWKLRRTLAFGASLFFCTQAGQAAGLVTYTGMCEASAAVALPEAVIADAFVVANDEDNILRVYRSLAGGAPVAVFDLNTVLEPTPRREADFEGATWLDDKVLWIGSHSRNSDGERRKDRRQFFATSIAAGATPVIALEPQVSLHDLAEVISRLDPVLSDAILLDIDEKKELAPDNGGFNVEGLAVAADGTAVMIGLRSPQTLVGRAIVIPFANPMAALAGESPLLGPIVQLDLGDRGIRSMEFVPSLGSYLIVAGPVGGQDPFAVFRWSGKDSDAPVEVPNSAATLAGLPDFTPEAMIPLADGMRALLLSDDGDRCPNPPSFRGALVDLD